MDHLRQLAEAFYRASSSDIQSQAHEFFNSLDSDGDGHIDQNEFISVMSEWIDDTSALHRLSNPGFFNALDTDRNGTLDFWEVITLFYIAHSGRPFCGCCGDFIPATYFTCAECGDVTVCLRCYENRKSTHDHHGQPAVFVDNYILLENMKSSSGCSFNSNTDDVVVNNVVSSPATPNTNTTAKPNTTTTKQNTTASPNTTTITATPNTTNARPRPNNYERPRPNNYERPRPNNTRMQAQAANYEECRLAIDAFQLALNIGNTCSIM